MIRRCLILTALFASVAAAATAQEPPSKIAAFEWIPPTQLETVLLKPGGLILADFYHLGWITAGDRGGRLIIDAAVVTEPGREERRTRGLRLEVSATNRILTPDRSYLDLEEVERLSRAMPYMIQYAARWKDIDKEEYTEVQFATKGEFRIGFTQDKRDQRGFVSSGPLGAGRIPIDVSEFPRVKVLLDQAVTLLQGK